MINSTDAKKLLTGSGIRSTKARVQILEYLIDNPIHPNAEELKFALNRLGDTIPTATLYQSLEKLTAAKLLLKFPGTDGHIRYDANLKHHHHLICTSCHKVLDVHLQAPLSELTITEKEGMAGWEVNDERIELKGLCPDCRNK